MYTFTQMSHTAALSALLPHLYHQAGPGSYDLRRYVCQRTILQAEQLQTGAEHQLVRQSVQVRVVVDVERFERLEVADFLHQVAKVVLADAQVCEVC